MMSSGSLSLFPFRKPGPKLEWIGSRYTLQATVREGDAILQPEIVMWLELPSGVVLAVAPSDPRQPFPFVDTLIEAMAHPAAGPPRRPSSIRVPDQTLADSVRTALGKEIPVVVGPVPELDAAFAGFSEAMSAQEPHHSYFGNGDISADVVGRLFAAAATFFHAAPWRQVSDEQIVRVDIPQLGIDGACLSVIGAAGESFGLLFFQSIETFADFIASGPEFFPDPDEISESEGGSETFLLSLSFDRKRDLPSSLVREIKQYRWPVGGGKAYPALIALDAQRCPRPSTERDVKIMTACASAFTSFLARHGRLFRGGDLEMVRETFQEEGLSLTLSAPILVDVDEHSLATGSEDVPPPMPSVRRNDPCPCGSGKKYKKCHLGAERTPVQRMGFEFARDIGRFAFSRFGPRWFGGAGKDFVADDAALPLFFPWLAWTAVARGERVAESFLEENRHRLSPDELQWFAAQRNSWLGVWEVTRVDPGKAIDVRDLLTGQRRTVREILGSRSLVVRDAILARVIDYRDTSIFDGMFARALPPIEAAGVVRRIRSRVRAGQGPVVVARLQDGITGRFMIDLWQETVDEYDERRSAPPRLVNRDGDPLLVVTETFEIEPGQRAEIEKRLQAIDGARKGRRNDEGEREITCVRADDTVIGHIVIGKDSLRLETNSEPRAGSLHDQVQQACPEMLRRGRRTAEDMSAKMAGAGPRATISLGQASPREQALIRDTKAAHYREWIDSPVAFLDGRTPRAASRSAKWREKLDVLLRDIENRESRQPEKQRADIVSLRRELGLED